jgi:hypothetical protein
MIHTLLKTLFLKHWNLENIILSDRSKTHKPHIARLHLYDRTRTEKNPWKQSKLVITKSKGRKVWELLIDTDFFWGRWKYTTISGHGCTLWNHQIGLFHCNYKFFQAHINIFVGILSHNTVSVGVNKFGNHFTLLSIVGFK